MIQVTVVCRSADHQASRATMTRTGSSMITQPSLLLIIGPQEAVVCRPYGAVTLNKDTNVINPTSIHAYRIMSYVSLANMGKVISKVSDSGAVKLFLSQDIHFPKTNDRYPERYR